MTILEYLQDNPIIMAPMAGISDRASRLIAREFGCGVVYTEMISAKALTYRNQKTFALMNMDGERQPIAMQIFGSEPDVMAQGAQIMVEHGAKWIDINMGCPVPKVVNNMEGSALLKQPALAEQIVAQMVRTVSVPISIKMRKGWDSEQCQPVEFAKRMEAAGASAIAVHGRTRVQYYSGEADWESIAAVKQAVQVPVIGNGDVFHPEDAKRMMDETGCDGVMIGRGALGHPWLYQQALEFLRTGKYTAEPTLQERGAIMLKHAALVCEEKGERTGMQELRKHIAWYCKGLPNSSRMREESNHVSTIADLQDLIDRYWGNS